MQTVSTGESGEGEGRNFRRAEVIATELSSGSETAKFNGNLDPSVPGRGLLLSTSADHRQVSPDSSDWILVGLHLHGLLLTPPEAAVRHYQSLLLNQLSSRQYGVDAFQAAAYIFEGCTKERVVCGDELRTIAKGNGHLETSRTERGLSIR